MFLRELEAAGGLDGALYAKERGGWNAPFTQKFMELTNKDWQFVEYQFGSIYHGSNMVVVREWAGKHLGVPFKDLPRELQEFIFSETVHSGKLSKASLRFAFSNPDTSAKDFSIEEYEGGRNRKGEYKANLAKNPFFQKELAWDRAVKEQKELDYVGNRADENKRNAETASKKAEAARDEAERARSNLIAQSKPGENTSAIRKAERNYQRAEDKLQQASRALRTAETALTQAAEDMARNKAEIDSINVWRAEQVRKGLENLPTTLKNAYQHRGTFIAPSEKERFARENAKLLERIQQRTQTSPLGPMPQSHALLPFPDLFNTSQEGDLLPHITVPLLPNK